MEKLSWKRKILSQIPKIGNIYRENEELKKQQFHPPGHFYSPIVSTDEITKRGKYIWPEDLSPKLNGIELNPEEQVLLMKSLVRYHNSDLFTEDKKEGNRYFFNNDYYTHAESTVLYCIIAHFQTKRIIEVGSGYSSAVMLDVNEKIFGKNLNLTFIEPNPERLMNLLKEGDYDCATVIQKQVQDVDLSLFKTLENGDILFIDSSHVVKTASDVNYLIFEVLPILRKGVLIHFHDVYYPFEYPRNWVEQGRNWNESYLLRAFLMYNYNFKIILYLNYLRTFFKDMLETLPPNYGKSGSSLWLEKM